MQEIKDLHIGNKKIGSGHPTYVIAEAGSNFDGSLSKAKKLIKKAKDCGADAAKFQIFLTLFTSLQNTFWKGSQWSDQLI